MSMTAGVCRFCAALVHALQSKSSAFTGRASGTSPGTMAFLQSAVRHPGSEAAAQPRRHVRAVVSAAEVSEKLEGRRRLSAHHAARQQHLEML
jgi:hypothetical protein